MANAASVVVLAKAVGSGEVHSGDQTQYLTHFEILDPVKGQIQSQFSILHWNKKIRNLATSIAGDPEFETGSIYYLCLDPAGMYYKPTLLSYGILKQVKIKNTLALTPIDESGIELMSRPDGVLVEPFYTYNQSKFLDQIRSYCVHQSQWNAQLCQLQHDIIDTDLKINERGSPPSHCTFFTGANGYFPRWTNFPGTVLTIKRASGGDSGCSDAASKITTARNNMATAYPGTNLSTVGTHGYSPTCPDASAIGTEFITYCDGNGGDRQLLIQFNDPCSEIADLNSCTGILAIGGTYWYEDTPHMFDGMNWWDAGYGFVVTNNGMGTCICSSGNSYRLVMTHEMTHALDIGHIAASNGTANMNPVCCNEITVKDQQCLNYTYPAASPVELISFDAIHISQGIELNWIISSEKDIDVFSIERSSDLSHFNEIKNYPQQQNIESTQKYQWIDPAPLTGISYYRLKWKEFGGKIHFSPIRKVELFKSEFIVYPNPAIQQTTVLTPEGNWTITLHQMNGIEISTIKQEGSRHSISLPTQEGVYYIQIVEASTGQQYLEKITVGN